MGDDQHGLSLIAGVQIYHPGQEYSRYYRLIALIILIAIFIVVAMQSIWKLRVAAERTHVAWMAGAMQSAIGLEIATRAVKGGLAEIAKLDRSNPLELLENHKRPMMGAYSFVGELDNPDPAEIAPRSWYFDTRSRELVYRVAMTDAFITDLEGPARVRFALKGRYQGKGRNRHLNNITLIELDRYRWIETE
ncbi:MAG: hypothetical protein OQK13_03205 [Gammaproteobacteria bacterium]|nr:hypothetical protein [Gammaproteobacteria bacterium]